MHCSSIRRLLCWWFPVAIAVASISSLPSAHAGSDALLDALKQREDQFPAFRIAWKVVRVEPGRSPVGFTTYEMLVEGDRFRIVRHVQGMVDPLRRAPTSFKNTFTDDGTVQHNFVSDFSDAKMTPTGNRSYTGRNGVLYASDDDVLPLLLYFRPEAKRLHRFDLSDVTVTPAENGQTQIVSVAGNHKTLWQSAAPFGLVQWQFMPPESQVKYDRWLVTMDYAPASTAFGDRSDVVIPVGFKVQCTSPDDQVRWLKEVKVTDFSSSPSVPADSFVIDYPEGTPVINGDDPGERVDLRAEKADRGRFMYWLIGAAAALVAVAIYRVRRR
jgi:hypothetical protein